MSKATQSTFQAYLSIASLNDLHGSCDPYCSFPTGVACQSCHILGSVAKDSKIQWRGRGWEGVSNCSDSQMPANTPGENIELISVITWKPNNLIAFKYGT